MPESGMATSRSPSPSRSRLLSLSPPAVGSGMPDSGMATSRSRLLPLSPPPPPPFQRSTGRLGGSITVE